MASCSLICHPATPCTAVSSILVTRAWTAEGLVLRWRLEARVAALRLPNPAPPGPADELWRHTCFEAFVAVSGSPAYREFNFSPSGQWAVYDFSAYRQRNEDFRPAAEPNIVVRQDAHGLELEAWLPAELLPPGDPFGPIGLTAVMEEGDGTLSYWALAHPSPRPDFHHPDSFLLPLTIPDQERPPGRPEDAMWHPPR